MPLAVGEVFAGYTIVRKLGAGGMGSVYLAQHPRLPRKDALKVLAPELTADPQYRARFLREADVVASLFHPHILGVHDRGEYNGQLWIAMDYIQGTDAASLLREHYPTGIPPEVALDILTPVAAALDHAHQHGLLHRDVKPANIFLTEPEPESGARWVFLAHFGIARRIDDTAGLTATNMAIGTVAYAAPEQLMGQSVDPRADQYALACTAFHILTGTRPYESSSAASSSPNTSPPHHPRSAPNDPNSPSSIPYSPKRWPRTPTTAMPTATNSSKNCGAGWPPNPPSSSKPNSRPPPSNTPWPPNPPCNRHNSTPPRPPTSPLTSSQAPNSPPPRPLSARRRNRRNQRRNPTAVGGAAARHPHPGGAHRRSPGGGRDRRGRPTLAAQRQQATRQPHRAQRGTQHWTVHRHLHCRPRPHDRFRR